MLLRRFLLVMALALVAQAGAFAFYYRDLLVLRSEPTSLAAAPETLAHAAETALARPALTRQHLETIVVAAHRAGEVGLEVQALARLAALEPDDPAIALRYGDALRRAGRLEQAERVFRAILASGTVREPRS